MPKSTIKNLLLVFVSLLLVISFCEFIARWFIPVRSVGPSFTIYDPVYGKRLKRNFSSARITPEFKMRFSTNSLGFRGPEPPIPLNRPILFLGDSFTMGYGVNDGEEFPALIRKSLAAQYGVHEIPVINAGTGDNGNGRWVKFLRKEGNSYNPRLVILQLMENDFRDNLRENLFGLSEHNELLELPVPALSMTRRIQNFVDNIPLLANSHLIGIMNQARWSLTRKLSTLTFKHSSSTLSYSVGDRLTFRLLEEVMAICDHEGWPMLALVVGIDGERLAKLKLLLEEKKVPGIEVPGRKIRPDLYYELDGHWNSRGHLYASQLIMNKLQEYPSVKKKTKEFSF